MDERYENDTQTESCRQCGDTGWMIEADRGTRRAQRCECWAVRRAAARLEAAGIPERYANCSFDTFTVYDNGYLEAAIWRARQFAVDFPAVKKGLLFIGRPGVGKTHLAVATLRAAMAESNLQGAFEDTRQTAGIATARGRAEEQRRGEGLRTDHRRRAARARRHRRRAPNRVGRGHARQARDDRDRAVQREATDDLHHELLRQRRCDRRAAGPDRQPLAVAAARDVPLVRAVRPGLPHARAQPLQRR